MHACLGVTFHVQFWQNDRGFLRATAVTRVWNGHRIRVSTQSFLLPPFLPEFELATFRSRVRRSYQQAIPVPSLTVHNGMYVLCTYIFVHFCLLFSFDLHVIEATSSLRICNVSVLIWKLFTTCFYLSLHLCLGLK